MWIYFADRYIRFAEDLFFANLDQTHPSKTLCKKDNFHKQLLSEGNEV